MSANQQALDRYTLVHGAVGFVVGKIGVRWQEAVAGAVLFEAIEDALKDEFPKVFPESAPDSKLNALADVMAFLGGYTAAAYIDRGD